MSKIPTTTDLGDFKSIPDGRHNLRIGKVNWNDKTGKLSILYQTEAGESDFENYSFYNSDGAINIYARRNFSFLVRSATGNLNDDGVEPEDLLGLFITAEVSHEDYTGNDGKTRSSARFNNKAKGTPFTIKRNKPEPKKEEEEELPFDMGDSSSEDSEDWLNF